jgi:hypothetical protein
MKNYANYYEFHESRESLDPRAVADDGADPMGLCEVCRKLRPLTLIDDEYDGIAACAECEGGVRHYIEVEK